MAFLTLMLALIAPPSRTGEAADPAADTSDQEETREKPVEQVSDTALASSGRSAEGLYTVKKGGATT
ncbi:MAG: hypothetical protein ACKVQA_08795 [Burkholderiales bacterium]